MSQTPGYYSAEACDLAEFDAITSQELTLDQLSFASEVIRSVPIYHNEAIAPKLANPGDRYALMAEFANVLGDTAGAFVIKNAQPNHAAIDAATQAYQVIIAEEKAAGAASADHFAKAGNNDRIWNSLEKLAIKDPATFIDYFASPAVDAACEAWLGPNYQMTAQVNLVRPGGKAQLAHRDYHLGFQSAEVSAQYPARVHQLSPLMTLQGGIAHVDMPVESGPTKLLPFSQAYLPGYAAWRREDFRALFEQRYVQLPLEKGDAVFFNPAIFHGAGDNVSPDVQRLVNLLQISSPFGRAMESIDRVGMSKALYPALSQAWQAKTLSEQELDASIAAFAEGYSFPTNLDRDPPIGGLAPQTQAALVKEALHEGYSADKLFDLLDQQAARKL